HQHRLRPPCPVAEPGCGKKRRVSGACPPRDGIVEAFVANKLPSEIRAIRGAVHICKPHLAIRGIGSSEDNIPAEMKDAVLEGVEHFLGPIFIVTAGDHELIAVDEAGIAMDIEVGRVVDRKAMVRAQLFEPAREIDLIFKKRRGRWPVEGNDGAALRFVLAWIEAVAAPTVVSLIGVGAKLQEDALFAGCAANDDLSDLQLTLASLAMDKVRGVIARRPSPRRNIAG